MNQPKPAIEARITRLLINSPLSYAEVKAILRDVLDALYRPVPYEPTAPAVKRKQVNL